MTDTLHDAPALVERPLIVPPRQPSRARHFTGDIEWYTPLPILEAAAEVMGGIDLDPATSDAQQARATAKARHYFTLEDDSLNQPWCGNTFLNPPYTRRLIDRFVDKLLTSYRNGEVPQAVLLTNSSTETGWWRQAFSSCTAVCFPKKRIHFLKVGTDGALTKGDSSPAHPHTVFYFGPDPARFLQVFSSWGLVFSPTAGAANSTTD